MEESDTELHILLPGGFLRVTTLLMHGLLVGLVTCAQDHEQGFRVQYCNNTAATMTMGGFIPHWSMRALILTEVPRLVVDRRHLCSPLGGCSLSRDDLTDSWLTREIVALAPRDFWKG